MVDRPRLTPEQVAGRSFPTSFRGFEQSEVRAFLAAVADQLRDATRSAELAAADLLTDAEDRAAHLLTEAQDEARRIRATLEAERDRAFAEGAAKADEVLAEAERVRAGAAARGQVEADRLVAEARAVRERVLGDLARRRATLREQVEQLHAARERLLAALTELRGQVDQAASDLRTSLPEAKMAADAAARRVAAEPIPSIAELEEEIAALRSAGIELIPSAGASAAEPDEAESAAAPPAAGAEADTGVTTPPDEAAVDAPAAETPVEAEAEQQAAEQTAPAAAAAAAADAPATPAGPERRSATVRVFRTRRDPRPAIGLAEPDLQPVEPAAPFEEVRLVAGEEAEAEAVQDAAEAAAGEARTDPVDEEAVDGAGAEDSGPEIDRTAAPEPPATQADAGVPAAPPTEAIDALFARLKAGRTARKAAADAVLEPTPSQAPAAAASDSAPAAEAEPARSSVLTVEAGTEDDVEDEVEAGGDEGDAAADRAAIARRDDALVGLRDTLAKRLKRQLADEQNEVLDALRRGERRAFEIADADDHAATWALAAARELAAAAQVGTRFGGEDGLPVPAAAVTEAAERLADAFARPLRAKVLEVIDAADGDRDVAANAVRAVYRDRRGRRLEDAVADAVLDAFAVGALNAAPVGAEYRWVVDDGPHACPDCDDNGLGGAVPAGSAFPTGHVRPPAHPGCRCLLVRARVR